MTQKPKRQAARARGVISQAAIDEVESKIVRLNGAMLRIRNFGARTDDPSPYKEICLDDYWLPATPITGKPVRLTSQPELLNPILRCLKMYAARTGSNKSTHVTITCAFKAMVKAAEFGWLHDIYSFQHWSKAETDRLLRELATGGWSKALNLSARTGKLIDGCSADDLKALVLRSKAKSGGYSIRHRFAEALGTSAQHQELIPAKLLILEQLGLPLHEALSNRTSLVRKKAQSYAEGMGATHLRQELSYINLLGECLPTGEGLAFVPYPDSVRIARQHGRATGRTENLTPDAVAALLKESFRWIKDISPVALDLLGDMHSALAKDREDETTITAEGALRVMKSSANLGQLERLVGATIDTMGLRHGSGMSLKRIVYAIATSCFIVIAFMNARRKDELQHRTFGLHRRALTCVDDDLLLYECEFYIEKTFQNYEIFYVSRLTRDAVQVLRRMSDLARAFDAMNGLDRAPTDPREDKLFHLPRIIPGKRQGSGQQWYDFNAGPDGMARDVVERALGTGATLAIHPHMFRRAYALLFHYRYENSSLSALAQQLGHLDLLTVLIYVTDSPDGVDTATAASYARGRPSPRKVHHDDCQASIKEVAVERVQRLARQVVEGKYQDLGGFGRLVQRFHQRFGSQISYKALDDARKAEVLADTFTRQGHEFRPGRSANCVASFSRGARITGCYSKYLGRAAPENANAVTCAQCPYSHYVLEHMKLWKQDLDAISARAQQAPDTVAGKAAEAQRRNLQRTIMLYEARVTPEVA